MKMTFYYSKICNEIYHKKKFEEHTLAGDITISFILNTIDNRTLTYSSTEGILQIKQIIVYNRLVHYDYHNIPCKQLCWLIYLASIHHCYLSTRLTPPLSSKIITHNKLNSQVID